MEILNSTEDYKIILKNKHVCKLKFTSVKVFETYSLN